MSDDDDFGYEYDNDDGYGVGDDDQDIEIENTFYEADGRMFCIIIEHIRQKELKSQRGIGSLPKCDFIGGE